MKRIGFTFVVAATTAFAVTAAAQTVGVGTGPAGSLTNRIGAGVAKVIADGAGLKTRAVPHTSNAHHVPLVAKGTMTFGVNSTGDINDVLGGTNSFEGRKTENWTLVTRLVPLPVGTLVRKDSPYKTLNDLKGKRYPVGFTAHKTVRPILAAFVGNAGMSVDDFEGVPVPNTHAASQLFLKGSVDGTLSSLGGSRLRNADAKVGGIRILGMNRDEKSVAAMTNAYPNSYLIELKPRKGSVGLDDGPVWVMAFDMNLMTSTKTPDEIVYKAVKALHGGKDGLVKISGVFRGFNPGKMPNDIKGVGIHPGAAKFYKEAGLMN